jgi:glycosyltransferase involved in cell wall biosynthesis
MADFRDAAGRCDLVHIFGLLIPSHALALRGLRLGSPLVVSTLAQLMPHGMRRSRLKKELYLAAITPWLGKASFHTFRPVEEQSVLRRFGSRVTFQASLGVFSATRPSHPKPSRRPDEPLRLLFLGRNDFRQKGLDILLQGFRLAVEGGVEASLRIAGRSWRDSRERLNGLVRRFQLEDRVQVLGEVSEDGKRELYATADYLVFLSRWDGPPRPVREAIAAGLPVIVSPETNMGYLVERHEAGVQVALDLERVAEVFRELASRPRGYTRYAKGVLKLRETLHWDKVAATYLAAYHHIVDDTQRAARF